MATTTSHGAKLTKRYGAPQNILPEDGSMCEALPFVRRELRPGDKYNFPIKVQNAHGVTHNVDGSAFALNGTLPATWKQAELEGAEMLFAENVSRALVAKMNNGGPADYGTALDNVTSDLMTSSELYRELNIMYGAGTASTLACSIGTIAASISGANLAAPQVVTITRATYAAGMWENLDGAKVDLWQSDGLTVRALDVSVSSPNLTNTRMTLTLAGSAAVATAGDVILLRGGLAKQCYGVQALLENTGTLFGISATTYPVWRALSYAVSGSLSIGAILHVAARLSDTGAGGGADLFVSSKAFAQVVETQQEYARYVEPASEKDAGADSVSVRTAIGRVRIRSHKYMKQSLGFLITKNNGIRVGACEMSPSLPGSKEWFWQELNGYAGAQMQTYSNQAPLLQRPSHCAILTGITSTGDILPS